MTTPTSKRFRTFTLLSVVLLGLVLLALFPAATSRAQTPQAAATITLVPGTEAASTAQATESGDPLEKLVIYSYPSGCEVHAARNGAPAYELMSGKNLLGTTPLEVPLAPGDYKIVVGLPDQKATVPVYSDGETSTYSVMADNGTFYPPFAKVYRVTKQAGHKAILFSLFWPKSQSLGDFVKALPDESSLFKSPPPRSLLEGIFHDHNVPPEDWNNLGLMFQKTGKAVWHGAKDSDYLYVYFTELEPQMAFVQDPAK